MILNKLCRLPLYRFPYKLIMWYLNIVLFHMVILFYINNNNNNNTLLLLYILYKCKNMILSRYCVEKSILILCHVLLLFIFPMHLSVLLLDLKGTYYASFYNMSNKSLMSQECVCEVLAQYTPQIIFHSLLKLPL